MQNETLAAILSECAPYHQHGSQWRCRCPAHDDTDPSLWLTEVDGKILWHCFAGCTQDAVFDAFKKIGIPFGKSNDSAWRVSLPAGIPYLYPTRSMLARSGRPVSAATQKIYRAHYAYRNTSGEIVGFVVRYERGDKKDTIPFFKVWTNGNWRSGHVNSTGRLLYNLDKLYAAPPNTTIYVVEGEKCADAFNAQFNQHGFLAVTWPGGCRSVRKADWTPLANRRIVVWCDYDVPGLSAGRSILDFISFPVTSISFVDITNLGFSIPGSDCVDWIITNPSATTPPAGTLYQLEDVVLPSQPSAKKEPKPKKEQEPASPPLAVEFALTEFGNVQRFLRTYSTDVVHTCESGWFVWGNTAWTKDESNLIHSLVENVLLSIPSEVAQNTPPREAQAITRWANTCQKASAVSNVVTLLANQQQLAKRYVDFDSDAYILNCPNGTIDLRSGSLRPHNKLDYCIRITNAEYRPQSRCPAWFDFLDYAFEGQPEVIEYFQRAVGYCITGDTSEQVFFATEGPGESGKGVAFETLAYVLGSYSASIKAETFLLDHRGAAATGDNSIASIRGARLCLSSEIKAGAHLNEARVKELTGQDTIQARFLYHEFFSFVPVAKFWLRCNGLPNIQGNDTGIWRRIRLLPFKRAVEKTRKDQYLRDKLKLEADGILRWCVEGCLLWQKHRLSVPPACDLEVLRYREDMDLVGLWFGDCCVSDPAARTSSTALYENYISWCEVQGEHARSQRWLSFELRSRGYHRLRVPTGSVYIGIRLKNDGMAMDNKFEAH